MHRIDDGVYVFLFLLLRVGVVEAQVAGAGVVQGQAKVQADRLGMAEMQVAVGLRREAGADFRRVAGAGFLLCGGAGPLQWRAAYLPALRSASMMCRMKLEGLLSGSAMIGGSVLQSGNSTVAT
jgi:hypothetical protein